MVDTVYLNEGTAPAGTGSDPGTNIDLSAGQGGPTGHGGDVNISSGASGASDGHGGTANLSGGNGEAGGGAVRCIAGNSLTSGTGGAATLSGGYGEAGNGGAGAVQGGGSDVANGGHVYVEAGNSFGGDGNGGNVNLTPGAANGSGIAGAIKMDNLQEFADDTAAEAGGIPVRGIYRTASALKIRVA